MSTRKRLKIFDELALSLDLVTERTSILATTGAGKTYLERVIAEELLELEQQVVVLDPKGDFWGLRSSADGKAAGYEIVIFGGEHADLELDYQAGAFFADLIVTERISAIFDLSDLTKAKQRVFVTDFAERLYYRKRTDRDPMLLIIDEADLFAPQKPRQSSSGGASKAEMEKLIGRMLDSMEDLVRRGRKRGIGTMLATQRSAVISKDVLDLTSVLIVMSTSGPRDLNAVQEWLEHHAGADERRAILDTLPSLPIGDAWIYSPRALKLLERAHVRESRTFDSSETPRAGRALRKPKTVRDLDLPALSSTMAEMRAKQEAEDPENLRREIYERDDQVRRLEEDLENMVNQIHVLEARTPERQVQMWEIPVIPEPIVREFRGLQQASENMRSSAETITQIMGRIAETITLEQEKGDELRREAAIAAQDRGHSNGHSQAPETAKPQVDAGIARDTIGDANGSDLTTAERKILAVLAQHSAVEMNMRKLGALTGYKPRGGAMGTPLASLRRRGLVEGLKLTDEGRRVAPRSEPLPRGRALLEHWMERLSRGEKRVLEYVFNHPNVTTQEIADALGYSVRGGALGTPLSKLRSRGLIVGGSGEIRCSEAFL